MTPLPEKYQWLAELDGLPRTISLAIELHGVSEVVGKGNSKTIMRWRDELNQAGVKISGYSNDEIPWCGLFAAIVALRRMGRASEVVAAPLWARSWAKYGKASPVASLGDILVFSRGDGGHVGFYIGEDAAAYHVIGGNQSNRVCITRILKNRRIAVRRPPYATEPQAMRPYRVTASGRISTDEA